MYTMYTMYIICISCIIAAINYYQEEIYIICYRDLLDIPTNKVLIQSTMQTVSSSLLLKYTPFKNMYPNRS